MASEHIKREITNYYSGCYDIDENVLERLVETIRERGGGEVDIAISLEGGESLSGSEFKSLFSDTTLEIRSIKSISLTHFEFRGGKMRVTLNMEGSRVLGPIRLGLIGFSGDLDGLKSQIDRLIRSRRRAHTPMNYSHPAAFICYVLIAAVISLSWTVVLFSSAKPEHFGSSKDLFGFLVAINFFGAIPVIVSINGWLFPKIEFRVGKSKRDAERKDLIRKFIVSTIIFGTILAVFQQFIVDLIKDNLSSKRG